MSYKADFSISCKASHPDNLCDSIKFSGISEVETGSDGQSTIFVKSIYNSDFNNQDLDLKPNRSISSFTMEVLQEDEITVEGANVKCMLVESSKLKCTPGSWSANCGDSFNFSQMHTDLSDTVNKV